MMRKTREYRTNVNFFALRSKGECSRYLFGFVSLPIKKPLVLVSTSRISSILSLYIFNETLTRVFCRRVATFKNPLSNFESGLTSA